MRSGACVFFLFSVMGPLTIINKKEKKREGELISCRRQSPFCGKEGLYIQDEKDVEEF